MNNEILDYEITVLNKHEDENSLVRAEQKRKVIEDQQKCHQDHQNHGRLYFDYITVEGDGSTKHCKQA